ncbi:DUF724 domain-containing protein 6-like isoform X2 [Hibiscus syriacus]|uniref:DUF724 domain-containing protein 6-like isoform X2 n=1 Tax=Hibiscus syriacus TaxID=106335 RepID=UPI0019209141|nr:DUF724 domain-containing protein 6-like isoform X2 [Hibiscus syriacus]
MVNPPPEPDTLQQQPTAKGTLIEVCSGEEGFRGPWYLATILESPPKSISKKRKRPLVRYKALRAQDGSSPLTEYVDPDFIRPLPPNDKEDDLSCFEVNEIVDAWHRDGWWTGVVRKVLEKAKYMVYFDNPPDVIEFDGKDLRVHWDWIDGKWVRPEKQQSTGSIFSSGTAVEVNTNDENLRDVWFPAIVIKENGDTTFLVKQQNSKNGDESGAVTVVVDSLHIRPSPHYSDRNYGSLLVTSNRLKEIPDETSCEEGTGVGFTKKTAGDWSCSKTESYLTEATTQTASNGHLFCQHHHSNWKAKKHKVGSVASIANNLVKRSTRARKSPGKGPQVLTAEEGILETAEEINEGEVKTKEVDMPIISGLTAKFTKTLCDKKSFQIRDLLKRVNDSVRNKSMEIREHKVGVNQTGKRGRPRKSVVTTPKAFVSGKVQNGAGGLADKNVVKDCTSNEDDLSKQKGLELAASQDALRGRTSDDPKTKEVHLPSAGISNMADEDQPLSTWIVAIQSSGDENSRLPSALVKECNEDRGLVDVPVESLAVDARSGSLLEDDRSLPFVKKSSLWQTIESMDVFQTMPQKPHFQPLAENREEFREGSAIGIMVTFASLFEKISALCFDDPRDTFDSIFYSLSYMEKHGFVVTLLRDRLNKLLSIKEGHGQRTAEIKNTEREIIENTEDVTKLDEEMEEIEKKITELQERRAVIQSDKEAENLKIAGLKLHVDVLNEQVQNNLRDFKKLATAPWKSP